MPRQRVKVIVDGYRKPRGTSGVVIGRMNGLISVDFGTGFGVLLESELEVLIEGQEGTTEALEG